MDQNQRSNNLISLYRWAEKVWRRALDVIHEYSRNKYAKR